jgi:integrase
MMDQRVSMNVLFYIKRTKLLKTGEAPIYLRITVNGTRAEVGINRSVLPKDWSSEKGAAKGNSRNSLQINTFLESIRDCFLFSCFTGPAHSDLKEIADLCGIKKKLTSHIARHTFATTFTLNNDIPFETVSKMLGHSNFRTTRIYAKLLDKKVGEDMSEVDRVVWVI